MNRTKQTKGKQVWWLLVSALFAGGIMTGIVIDRVWTRMEQKPMNFVEKHEGGYTFINPLLECDSGKDSIGDQELRPFQKGIQAFIDDAVRRNRASSVSVYFRDLSNGPAFGVNEDERYTLASLLKVPLMIVYLKAAESQPALLKKKLLYDGKQDRSKIENFKGSHAIKPGKSYTVEELIKMMIMYSDNNAAALLDENMDEGYQRKVFEDIGLFDPMDHLHDIMSVEQYTSCFRILFNSSYLRRDLSEQALRYLAYPDFSLGIIGGVPPGVAVAQKFGEREFPGVKELHDCGIVYYPNLPYLLCIMTRGTDYADLSETISDLSRLVYAHVDANQKMQRTEHP